MKQLTIQEAYELLSNAYAVCVDNTVLTFVGGLEDPADHDPEDIMFLLQYEVEGCYYRVEVTFDCNPELDDQGNLHVTCMDDEGTAEWRTILTPLHTRDAAPKPRIAYLHPDGIMDLEYDLPEIENPYEEILEENRIRQEEVMKHDETVLYSLEDFVLAFNEEYISDLGLIALVNR